jgi:hypothetical protein
MARHREREPTGYLKLSRLQCFVMVALLDMRYAAMPRGQFSEFVYKTWFKEHSPSTRASLSRAYRRLEARGYLIRADGRWQFAPAKEGAWIPYGGGWDAAIFMGRL